MRRTKLIITICLLIRFIFLASSLAMTPESDTLHLIEVADMDKDGIPDSVWYNNSNATMYFLFSRNGFEPIEYCHYYDLDTTAIFRSSLEVYEDGFGFINNHMRGTGYIYYVYEEESNKFRQTESFWEHYTVGYESIDFDKGEFVADWWYYDYEADSLVNLPTLNISFNLPPVYFGEKEPNFISFDSYGENYEPPTTDTIRFISFHFDPEDDFYYLSGTTVGGEEYHACVNMDFKQLYRDDLVKVTESTCGYFNREDTTFNLARMITEMEIIEPGKLTQFYENNKQLIRYYGEAEETLGPLQIEGIDYYIATYNDKILTEYLTKPGNLAIHFYQKPPITPTPRGYWCEVIINHEYEGKQTEIKKLLMEITIEHHLNFYLYDDKTEKIIPL